MDDETGYESDGSGVYETPSDEMRELKSSIVALCPPHTPDSVE